jgi:hypothetical protein
VNLIQQIMIENGITRVLCDDSAATLQTDREDWEVGTSFLTIINQLLSEINFMPLWFDLAGNARLSKKITPSASNIAHEYKSGELSIIKADCSVVMDTYAAPNVFIVTCSNPDLPEPMQATSVNDNVMSPLSTVRRGRRIVAPPVRVDNIASQEELQAKADLLRMESMLGTEAVGYATAINPVHEVGDVVALTHERLEGIFMETEWQITMGAGNDMQHKGKRVTYLD